MQLALERIAHHNVVSRDGDARTRIAPVTIHRVRLGQLDGMNDFTLQNIDLVQLAVLREDIGKLWAHRIDSKMHATGRQLHETETTIRFRWINQNDTVRSVVAREILQTLAADQGRRAAFR
ncbi:hypothetical protein D3C80_1833400 [compost metagenome]